MRDIQQPTTPALKLGAPTAAEPDAELIAMCAELDRLERARKAIEADDEDAFAPLEARQHELLLRIWAAPARSLRGIRAKAQSFVVWMPEALEAEACSGFEWNYTSSILRDLLQGSAAA